MDIARLERVLVAALHDGYAEHIGVRAYRLKLAMDCENPYRFELYSRGSIRAGRRVRPLTLHGESRCRKCGPCAVRRSRMWAARAIYEWEKWPLTLFGTFTMSPQEHYEVDCKARLLMAAKHESFDRASDAEKFRYRATVFGHEVSNWIKRIRSGRDGHTFIPIRYLLVAEAHESVKTSAEMWMRPHYHMLLHSMELGTLVKGSPHACIEAGPQKLRCDVASGEWECRNVWFDREQRWLPKAFLRDESFAKSQWSLGHTKWQWADTPDTAFYVCKYLTKSMHQRVRASVHYGCETKVSLLKKQDRQAVRSRASLTPPAILEGVQGEPRSPSPAAFK